MRLFTAFLIAGGILIFAFALSLGGNLPPGVRMGQGIGQKGVMESTFGPQPPDPFASQPPRVMPLGEDIIDEATLEEIRKRVLTPANTEGATLIQALPTLRGGGEGLSAAPSLGTNFAGPTQSEGGGGFPPDPIMASGPNHVIVAVNTRWSIYSKTGGAPVFTTPFGSWFASVNPAAYSPSDPKVMYDHYSGRWIVMIIGFPPGAGAEGAYFISVSDDSDPNGFWYKWSSPAHIDGSTVTTNLADYPGVGYDSSEAVYITSRQFAAAGGFQYAKVRIFKKSELYRTDSLAPALTYTDFVNMTDPGSGGVTLTIKPALTHGPINGNFLLSNNNFAGNYVELWRINDPAGTPSLVHLRTDTVGSYSAPPHATQPAPGCFDALGEVGINTVDARITAEVNYRNGYLYFAFATGFNWGSGTVSAVKYIQMDTTGNLIQNIIYGADGEWFFFPAPYPIRSGEVGMVYSHSSPSSFVSARYVGNFPGDLSQGVLKASATHYCQVQSPNTPQHRNRWGDYTAGVGDPSFPRRVWFFNQYAAGVTNWATWCGFISLKNSRPEIQNPTPIIIDEGDTLIDTILVTDPDGENIASFTALSKPAYATFTNLGGGRGVLKLTPGYFDAGVDTVKLRAADNGIPSASDTEFVEIIVNEKNAPPALSISLPDSVKVYACCSLSALLTATDVDSGPGSLVLFASSLPAFATLVDSGGGLGSLNFAPGEPDVGDYVVIVLATDSADTTNSTVPVKVLPRGDLTGDGILTPADVVSELNCAFLGIPPPVSSNCDNCDFDGGGASASDVVLLLNATFLGIPLPACS